MRNRLLLVMVGVVALVLAVHDIPLANHLERVERDRLVTRYERDAFILAGRLEEGLEDGTAQTDASLRTLVVRYAAVEDVEVVVADRSGVAVISSDDAKVGEDVTNRPEIVAALESGDPGTGQRPSETIGGDLFYVAVPVLSGIDRVGVVRITAPEQVVADRVSARIRGILAVAMISLLIATAVAWLFARSVTEPLRRLGMATDDLAAGDLARRAATDDGPREVRALAGSFNTMADRLEQQVDRQRAFAGTASHQLRTPLTALRIRLEQVAAELDDRPEQLDDVERALAETDRLHRMIEGLLVLTRADAAELAPERVDLAAVVRERAEHWAALAEEQQVGIEIQVPPSAWVVAVPGGAEQIVDNLIDNALEVSPQGARLLLSVVPADGCAVLHVVDEGPGLSDQDRQLAFDRFWRAEGAPVGGSGLGLAIVDQLATAAGGSAALHAASTGGIDAAVTFRLAR